jgi:hypothetical protein
VRDGLARPYEREVTPRLVVDSNQRLLIPPLQGRGPVLRCRGGRAVTVSRQNEAPPEFSDGAYIAPGGYHVVPTPNHARGGGLAAVALQKTPSRVVAGNGGGRGARVVSARARARIERQTGVVHDASTTSLMRRWVAAQAAEAERMAIRQDLARAGLL